jgi:hypothetical protein
MYEPLIALGLRASSSCGRTNAVRTVLRRTVSAVHRFLL